VPEEAKTCKCAYKCESALKNINQIQHAKTFQNGKMVDLPASPKKTKSSKYEPKPTDDFEMRHILTPPNVES
jgi:hypothetical protein